MTHTSAENLHVSTNKCEIGTDGNRYSIYSIVTLLHILVIWTVKIQSIIWHGEKISYESIKETNTNQWKDTVHTM